MHLTISVPPTVTTGRILTRPLFEERFVCIVRKDHAAARAPLSLQTFVSLSHLLVSPEGDRFGRVDAALAKQGVTRRLALTLPHMQAAPALIARSNMISTVLAGAVAASCHAGELCVLDSPLDIDPVPFVMSWRRRNDQHPAQLWFRDCIASLLASFLAARAEPARVVDVVDRGRTAAPAARCPERGSVSDPLQQRRTDGLGVGGLAGDSGIVLAPGRSRGHQRIQQAGCGSASLERSVSPTNLDVRATLERLLVLGTAHLR